MYDEKILAFVDNIKEKGLYRQRIIHTEKNACLNFSSNDYLSLNCSKDVRLGYEQGFKLFNVGSAGSALITGYQQIHADLENEFAKALKVDNAILFSSGYSANISLSLLLSRLKFNAIIDKNVHASFYDGLKLAAVNFMRFKHNDIANLETILQKFSTNSIILTETLFSMSGEKAPIKKISQLALANDNPVIVDEAHAFGVYGKEGLGLIVENQFIQQQIPLRVIPLGKAFGAQGAIVAGCSIWIDALIQCARPYIYSTALSPAFTFGLLKNFEIMRAADDRRKHLFALIAYFREKIKTSANVWRHSDSAIQQLKLGCPFIAQQYAKKLCEKGIVCMPIRQPTVNKNDTGLRVIINYQHNEHDIDYLFKCLAEI